MRLRVLGSSGSFPTTDNPSSGFLLDGSGAKIWLEAGTGTFAALCGVDGFTELQAVVVTHAHSDHCLDLFPLYYARLLHPEQLPLLPLFCPRQTWNLLGRFFAAEGPDKLSRVFELNAVDDGDRVEIGDLALAFRRTDHPLDTLAVRVESGGGALTYSADTGPGFDLTTFAQGSDLFLCEATYLKESPGPPVHLTAEQAGEIAAEAGVGELALTHISPHLEPTRSLEEARSAAGQLSVSLARPGKVFQVVRREGE